MRWKDGKRIYPEIGNTRVVHRFLLLPKTFDGETRWLERAAIRQEFMEYRMLSSGSEAVVDVEGWRDVAWITPHPVA